MPKHSTRLVFLSSFEYPTRHAHPIHGLDMAREFAKALGDGFVFICGRYTKSEDVAGANAYTPFIKASKLLRFLHMRALAYAVWFFLYSWSEWRTKEKPWVYLIDPYLAFILILLKPFGHFRIAFEGHHVYTPFLRSFIYRFADSYFFITASLKTELSKDFPRVRERSLVVPSAVYVGLYDHTNQARHTLRAEFDLPSDAIVALYLGSVGLYSWKGVDVFLDSLKLIDEKKILLVVAGVKDEDQGEFKRQFSDPRIKIFGWLTRAEVPRMLSCADVLVLPNKKGDPLSEKYTSPMKLFEYMASGIPIVASDLPAMREILNERNALLVEPNSPAALAQGITEAISDSVKSAIRAQQAQKDVQTYSWSNRVARILNHLSLESSC